MSIVTALLPELSWVSTIVTLLPGFTSGLMLYKVSVLDRSYLWDWPFTSTSIDLPGSKLFTVPIIAPARCPAGESGACATIGRLTSAAARHAKATILSIRKHILSSKFFFYTPWIRRTAPMLHLACQHYGIAATPRRLNELL